MIKKARNQWPGGPKRVFFGQPACGRRLHKMFKRIFLFFLDRKLDATISMAAVINEYVND